MGLFDGAPPNGKGSTADLARILGLPVVLIVDAKAMSQSVAALVSGFARFDPTVRVAGVILNRVGSDRHTEMLKTALAPLNIPVLGAIPRRDDLSRPSRHLGLIQAGEMPDLEACLDRAAACVASNLDLTALRAVMAPSNWASNADNAQKPTRIAIAKDTAFSFIYPHMLADLARRGATVLPFSPLADDPVPDADCVFLPGGYPELFARQLAGAKTFMQSLRSAAQKTDIYGECGGYMTLGETLIDADGTAHKMAGLLGLTSSFKDRKLHLGYRTLHQRAAHPLIPTAGATNTYSAHEFHYATTLDAQGRALFDATDAQGTPLGPIGLIDGRVAGSFAHIIDRV
jgi:cobyrinic acid a,c-diamide synthase